VAEILLLGSDKESVSSVRGLLREDGHQVTVLHSPHEWRSLEREIRPELVVATAESSDAILSAPGRPIRGFPAPLLLVAREEGFGGGPHLDDRLVDRISSPFMREELLGRADALIRVRRVIHHHPPSDAAVPSATPDSGVPKRSGARALRRRLTALLGSRIPRWQKPAGPYLEVAARVADWADRRDAFEPGHAERVTAFCAMAAEGLGLGGQETTRLLRAAMLHDIGKVALPVEVLHQKTPLEGAQMRLIRTHPQRGAALLRALGPDEEIADAVLYHHECPDGSGYYGKAGESVPRTARILAVAEVYDALTMSRLREPMSRDQAIAFLESRKGETLDADSVRALVDTLKPRPATIPLATVRRP
jgi:putative nucleotidyltransferase with HDIG domain